MRLRSYTVSSALFAVLLTSPLSSADGHEEIAWDKRTNIREGLRSKREVLLPTDKQLRPVMADDTYHLPNDGPKVRRHDNVLQLRKTKLNAGAGVNFCRDFAEIHIETYFA